MNFYFDWRWQLAIRLGFHKQGWLLRKRLGRERAQVSFVVDFKEGSRVAGARCLLNKGLELGVLSGRHAQVAGQVLQHKCFLFEKLSKKCPVLLQDRPEVVGIEFRSLLRVVVPVDFGVVREVRGVFEQGRRLLRIRSLFCEGRKPGPLDGFAVQLVALQRLACSDLSETALS